MTRKSTSEKGSERNTTTVKKTPAQREKEEKENRLAALDGIVRDKIHDIEILDRAAGQLDIPDISGKKVIHRKFGQGEIVSSEGRFFKVFFSSGKTIKMQFPFAFDRGILEPAESEDLQLFEEICAQFRSIDTQKKDVDKRIYEISAEMSRINL